MSLTFDHLAKLAAKDFDLNFLSLVVLINVVLLHGGREWTEIVDERNPDHGATAMQVSKIIGGLQSTGRSLHAKSSPLQDKENEADMAQIRVPPGLFQNISPRPWKSSQSTDVLAAGTRPYVEVPTLNGISAAGGFHEAGNRPIKSTSRIARESPKQADIPPSGAKVASVSPWAIGLPSVRNHAVSHKDSELPTHTVVKEPYHSYQLEYVKGLVGRLPAPSFPTKPPFFKYLHVLFQRNHSVSGASAMDHLKLSILLERSASHRETVVLALCLLILPLLVIAAGLVIATADHLSLHKEEEKSASSTLTPPLSPQSSPQAAECRRTPKIPQVISSSTPAQRLPHLCQHLVTPVGRETTLLLPTLKPSGGEIAIGTTQETLFLARLVPMEHTHVPKQCDDVARDGMDVRLISADGNITLAFERVVTCGQGPHDRMAIIHYADGHILGTMSVIAGQCTFVAPNLCCIKFQINWVKQCVEVTGEAEELLALCTWHVEGASWRNLFIGPGVDPAFIILGILGLDQLNPWA